jgi:hypothetical protein
MDIRDRKEPNMGDIDEVLKLAREVADNDYLRHVEAAALAKTNDEREVAFQAIEKSMAASRALMQAQNYFNHSGESSKSATFDMLRGDQFAAEKGFDNSGREMQQAAERLRHFSDYVPKSKMMNAAVAFVAKKDDLITRTGMKVDGAFAAAEAKVDRTAESFSRGLRSFSDMMHTFGEKIKKAPEQIKDVALEKSISIAMATSVVATGIMSRFKQAFSAVKSSATDKIDKALVGVERYENELTARYYQAVGNVKDHKEIATLFAKGKIDDIQAAAIRGRDVAWDTMDRLGQASVKLGVEVKDRSIKAAETVERHASGVAAASTVPVAVATSLLKTLGTKMSETYSGAVEKTADEQRKRRGPGL